MPHNPPLGHEQFWALPQHSAAEILRAFHQQAEHEAPEAALIAPAAASTTTPKPYTVQNGVAIISISGAIIRKSSWYSSWFGQTGQDNIRTAFDAALADKSVKAILLDINSPGGVVSGTKELADYIAIARKTKPCAAYANGLCASAALWLASATGRIFAPQTAQVGSVGVLYVHTDWSKYNEKSGIAYTYITGGTFKAVGNEHSPLSESDKTYLQQHITAEAAGSAMTGMRTNFNLTQDGVRLLGDSINTLSNKFDTKAHELVDFTSRVGGTAASFKMTGHEVAALGAIFRATKVDTESASTAANAMFVRLANGSKLSKDAQAQLKKVGLTGAMLEAGMQKDAQGTLLNFLYAVKGSKNPLALLSETVGTDHAPKILKIVNSLDLYRETLKTVAKPAENAGSQMEEFKNVTDTAGARMRLAINAINKASIILGDALLPALSTTLQTVTPYISAIGDFASKHQGLTTSVVGCVAGLVAMKVASIPLLYGISLLKTAWHGAALATEFLRKRTSAKTSATTAGTTANVAHAGSSTAVVAGLRAQALASTVAAKGLRVMGGAWKYVLVPIGIAIGVFELLYNNVVWIKEAVDSFIETVATKFPSIGKPLKTVAGWLGIGKSDTDMVEEIIAAPTQTAHAAMAGQAAPRARLNAPPAAVPRPSASAPTSGNAGISTQFHFSLNGIPDADFAKRVMAAFDARKNEVERLVSNMVNDAVRLAYGS